MIKPTNDKTRVQLLALATLVALLHSSCGRALAQGVKGFSGSGQSISNFGLSQPITGTGGSSLSSSFVQMFNQLTPVQQQQFVRQMSSSNRRVFQQLVPQTSFNSFEETSSANAGNLAGLSAVSGLGGTKSAAFRQVANSQVLSPVQQNFFRSQQSKSFSSQPQIISPASQFSFSRQISSQVQPTVSIPTSSNEFQLSKTSSSSVLPQQSSYFNRVQQVQQVAQPVVLPASEQSFRRVQSFSSQPLAPVQTESGFTQQFVQQQQVQPQPVQSFNRFQPVGGFGQFSGSSSSNLAGGGQFGLNDVSTGGFSGALQQEKVDLGSEVGVQSIPTGGSFQNSFVQQQSSSPQIITIPSGSLESTSSSSGFGPGVSVGGITGFDSADAQQKNVPEDFYGLTAASINNKWYIMKPVENPSALGLGSAAASNMRQISLGKLVEASRSSSATPAKSAALVSGSATTAKPKKRSTDSTSASSESKPEEPKPSSTSSSLMDSEEEESESKK